MSDLTAQIAEQTGWPELLVMRSAQARAEAEGMSVDEVLAAWASGGSAAGAGAAAPAAAPAPEAAPSSEPAPTPEAAPAPAGEPAEEPVAAPEPPAPEEEPVPTAEPSVEPVGAPSLTVVETAGIRQLRRPALSRWLTAAFFAVPLWALIYILGFSVPECGGAQLDVDPRTGAFLDCDGTPYAPGGGGGPGAVDYVALGGEVYARTGSCTACHGAAGEGVAAPAMAGGAVLAAFPTCPDHITWVGLGSNRWREEIGDTYGALNTPVQGGMAEWGALLTEQELAAVVVYERVAFGGEAVEAALDSCGLLAEPGEEPPADEGGEGGGGEGGEGEGDEGEMEGGDAAGG